jgi:DNA-binding IclR family transcriptional regulator
MNTQNRGWRAPEGPTARVVAILDHLAEHGDNGMTLSQLSKELGISKATLHSIVHTLVEAGYLYRSESSHRYELGPALVPLGRAVTGHRQDAVDEALSAIPELASRFGVTAVVSAAIRGNIVILATASSGPNAPAGWQKAKSLPISPPMGTVFVAWSTPDDVERWIAQSRAGGVRAAHYAEAVTATRERGFALGLHVDARSRLEQFLKTAPRAKSNSAFQLVSELLDQMDDESYLVTTVDPGLSYQVSYVSAPVFDESGSVVIALSLVDFPMPLEGKRVMETGQELLHTTAAITAAIGGRAPKKPRPRP